MSKDSDTDKDRDRLHFLFAAHTDGRLTAEEHAELQERLRTETEARRLWFAHQDVEDGLHALAQEGAAEVAAHAAEAGPGQGARARARRGWLQWRPLTAAAQRGAPSTGAGPAKAWTRLRDRV